MTYTLHQWEQLIRGISREEGRIFFTKHALSQMKSRCITREPLQNSLCRYEPREWMHHKADFAAHTGRYELKSQRSGAPLSGSQIAHGVLQRLPRGMVIDVLRLGSLHRIPEPDIKTGDMVCKMERYVAGQHIAAIVALEYESASDCVVVTSYKF
jgi:hypothetical protein